MFTKDMAYWGKCICCYIFLQKASNILTKFGTAKNLQKNRIHDDNNAQNIIKAKMLLSKHLYYQNERSKNFLMEKLYFILGNFG